MMLRTLLLSLLLALAAIAGASSPESQMRTDADPVGDLPLPFQWAKAFLESLDPRKGRIVLDGGIATLDVPDGFYFLDAADSERVLTAAWGNPPGSDALGMLLPEGMTPFDPGVWAVTITYEETGHIADEIAAQLDAGKLLARMQRDAARETEARKVEGYESIAVVGWMQEPHYDAATHRLSWGRVLRFGSLQDNTLNVSIRVLGRTGMVAIELVADEAREAEVAKALSGLADMAFFNPGHRHEDFDPATDSISKTGLTELITDPGF